MITHNRFVLETLSKEDLLDYIENLEQYYEEKLQWMEQIDRDLDSAIWDIEQKMVCNEDSLSSLNDLSSKLAKLMKT